MRSSLNDYPIVRTDQWILALQQQAEQDNANAGGPGLVKPCKSCGHLSNLQKDPRQKRDLSLGQPGIVRGLTDFYQAHIDRGSSFAVDR